MNILLTPAVGVVGDVFTCYETVPFGLVEEDFVIYAMDQFQKHYERLERARGATIDEINRVTSTVIEEDSA